MLDAQAEAALLTLAEPGNALTKAEAARVLAARPMVGTLLRRLLRHHSDPTTRYAIVHALAWHDAPKNWNLFVAILLDSRETPAVRGQAAEGLAYGFHRKRKGFAGYEAAFRALHAATRDDEPEVRYFSAFALGNTRDARAIRALRGLVNDRARGKAFVGTVAEEAHKAIELIKAR